MDEEETYEDYIIKFGNLTLLPKAINIVASNHFFEDKRDEYLGENQSFKLTRAICADLKLGENTKVNKILNYAEIIKFQTWDKNTILTRQEQLAKLALLVWGFETV